MDSATDRRRAGRWVRTWQEAGPRLEQVRRDELRRLDQQRAIALLCGEADYTIPPRAPRPTSGLVEQQRWFRPAAVNELILVAAGLQAFCELAKRRAEMKR